MTSSTESGVAAAVNSVQLSGSSDHIVSRWLLVNKCPDVCYRLENNVANLPNNDDVRTRVGDVMSLCGGSQLQQQHRSPLKVLFGSATTSSTVTTSRSRSADTVAAPPWRPFSIHEDRPISAAPSLSTTASTNNDVRRPSSLTQSPVNDVDQAVPQHHTVLRSAVGRQYTATNFLPEISFASVLSDSLCSPLAIDQFHHQRLLSSVRQQVVDSRFIYPAMVTGWTVRQQCSQCGLVFSTLGDLIKHQQSSCSSLSKSSSTLSSSPQSGSTGSPPTRSPSPLLSCPHCDKTYTSSGALKMHVRTHTLPCRCAVCGKSFSRPWLLQGHLRTHTGERPFRCTVCGRAFADRSNLRAHSQTHAAAKRYQCTVCRRSFSRLSLLVRHERNTASGCCSSRSGHERRGRDEL